MKTDFTIVGGGIAGLTAAIALQNIGIKATVFEASPEIKAVGAGLALPVNAMKAFRHSNIEDDIIKAGNQLKRFIIYNAKGKVITSTNSEKLSRKYGISNFTIHRAALHRILLSKIDLHYIKTGKRTKTIASTPEGYEITFDDGTTHHTKYLIVAEGVNSVIRRKILPQSVLRYAGYTCWRGIVDNSPLKLTESFETWGTTGRFGVVPLANSTIYWFACINAPQNNERYKNFTVQDIYERFNHYHAPIGKVISSTKEENLIWNDIIDLAPIRRYAFDNLVLIGDAAHATTPNMGQGACQAIEDAVILAIALQRNSVVAHAFRSFETRRLKRTHAIVNQSWQLGRIAQLENKFLAGLRDTVFRLLPNRLNELQLEKLFRTEF